MFEPKMGLRVKRNEENWKVNTLKRELRTWNTGLENPVDPQTGKSALRERGLDGSLVGVGWAAGCRGLYQRTMGIIGDNVDAQGGTRGAEMTRCYWLVLRMHGWALPGPASEVLADSQACGRPRLGRETAQRARLCAEEDARMGTALRQRRHIEKENLRLNATRCA